MPIHSLFNNSYSPLGIDARFEGKLESTQDLVSISVNVFADVALRVIIKQYRDSNLATQVQENFMQVAASTKELVQTPIKSAFYQVVVINEAVDTAATITQITTYLQSSHYVNLDIRQLSAETNDSVLCYGLDVNTGLTMPLSVDASGSLIVVGGGGGDASRWADFPAVDNVDMDGFALQKITGINSTALDNLSIATQSGQIQLQTATNTLYANTLAYSALGNLSFSRGEQNINNLLGVTHSQGFTLTQNGGGVITFEDGTTMSTASGGGGGNFSTPSNQDLDMNTHKITGITELGGVVGDAINVDSDITFSNAGGNYINNVSNIVGNNPVGLDDPYLQISNLTSIYTPTSIGLQVNVAGGVNLLSGTNLSMGEGAITGVSSIQFTDLTTQTTAYQNPFQVDLDMGNRGLMNVNGVNGVANKGQTIVADKTVLISSNEEAVLVSSKNQIILAIPPSIVEFPPLPTKTLTYDVNGDLTLAEGTQNINNPLGTTTSENFTLTPIVGGGELNMNEGRITNAKDIIGATDSVVSISSDISVDLIADVNGTPKYASLYTNGVFNAKSFTLYQDGGGSITFPNGSTQTTAYTGADVQSITSTDGSITVTSPSANTVNLAVTSPYTLPVATTSVLGGVKPDGTSITATVDGTISATAQGITSNTFYVNDNVNNINDVIPLMSAGDIAIVSAGSFGQATDITWNVAQTGLSGSVAPIPLTFLTTANASRFTVSATQVRVANIKFQLPVFLSANNCTIDNCDFDDNLTIGTGVSGYITINNCEFIGTKTITVASTFTNVCYFINCNFLGSTFVLSQASSASVVFNNCAGFTSYPANATYVGINVLSSGSTQLSTVTIKSVASGGNVTYASQINMDGNNIINVNNISGRTGDPPSFTQSFEVASGAGAIQMRGNGITTCGTITQLIQGITLNSLTSSTAGSRNLWTVSIPPFVSGSNATFVFNDLGTLSLKNITLTSAGVLTFPDSTTQNTAYKNLDVQTITNTDGMLTITQPTTHGVTIQSAMKKGKATLSAMGAYYIPDNTVTASCVCVVTYAEDSPINGVLCAKVEAGAGITIQSTLLADVSPFFYMYFI